MSPQTSFATGLDAVRRPAGAAAAVACVMALAGIAGVGAEYASTGQWLGGTLFFAAAAAVLVAGLAATAALMVRDEPALPSLEAGSGSLFDEAGRRIRRPGSTSSSAPEQGLSRDLERRLYDAIESFPEAIVLWDAEDRLIVCNAEYRKTSGPLAAFARPGVSFEELLRKAIQQSLYETGEAGVEEFIRRRMAQHRNPGPPVEYPQNDGRWLLIREHRTHDGGIVSLYTDVTPLKRVQIAAQATAQELDEKRHQLDIALNNISQGIAFFDSEQRLILCNRRYRELYRLPDDIVRPGTTLSQLIEASVALGNYPPGEGERVLERRLAVARRREQSVLDTQLADGRLIEVNYQPLAAGGSVATFTDVTDREQSARALVAARDAAEQASRAKTEFLTKMSHELRTPLNAVIGFSEVIRDRLLGPVEIARYAEYAADIHFSGQHLLQVINDILDMSRIEAGQQKIVEETVDLAEQITHAQSILASAVRDAGVQIEIDLREVLPHIRADSRSVLQVLLNLLSNAVKFTPSGGRITIAATRDRRGDIIVTVSDTGIGIAERDQQQIFEPFFQAEVGTNRRYGGTGLGLSICRNIMSLHGGSIGITSAPGRGTKVTLCFPAARVILG